MKAAAVYTFAAALLLIAPSVGAEVTEELDRTVALAPGGSLDLSNVNGAIEIDAWDRNEVRIYAVKSARTAEALREVEVEIEESPDRITVRTHLPKGRNKGGSVAYQIQAPASAGLKAETVNGRVAVEGVRGDLTLESVNGSVNVGGAAAVTRAETVNGSLTVSYSSAPESGNNDLSSVNGALRLILPAGVNGEFTAKSVNGSIRTDFPLEVRKARFGPNSSLEGGLGSGGARYALKTVNGSIRILNGSKSAGVAR